MSKGPKTLTSNSTQTTTVDPTLTARQNQIWSQAQQVAGTPYQYYTGQRFAGFNPDQQASFDAARTAAGAGQTELNDAVAGTNLLTQFGAPQVNYQNAGTFTAAAPGAVGTINPLALGSPLAGGGASARDVTARTGATGYEGYMNPYTQQVVDTSLSDIERARREAENATKLDAAASGAFGGSRSGVAQALTNRDFGSLAASTAAGLRKSGFETALGYNAADQARELAAGQSNQAADVATSTANAQTGLQAGIANQGNLLSLALANQNAGMFNANQAADMARFNAGQQQQGAQFNAGNQLTAGTVNAGNAIASAGVRGSALAALAGLGAQRQQMGAQGADLLSRVGGQQQALDQAQKDFDYQQFVENRDHPAQQLDLLSRILAGQQYGSTSTSTATTPNPNRGSLFSTIAGLGGTLLGGPLGGMIGNKLGGLLGLGNPPAGGVSTAPTLLSAPAGFDPRQAWGGY